MQLRVAQLSRQFGVDADDPTLKRAAELSIYTEQMRRQLIRGDVHSVGIADVVKIENLASRACRDLATRANKPNADTDELDAYLAAKAAAKIAEPADEPADEPAAEPAAEPAVADEALP